MQGAVVALVNINAQIMGKMRDVSANSIAVALLFYLTVLNILLTLQKHEQLNTSIRFEILSHKFIASRKIRFGNYLFQQSNGRP